MAYRHAGHCATMGPMAYDPDRLNDLGRRYQRARAEVDAVRPDLADEIRAAAAGGMAQVDIVKATGYTRDQIRQICLPPARRRSRAKVSSATSG